MKPPDESAPPRPVLIAGGGIAGLTFALCLARRGIASHVLERAPRLNEAGAGIQLSPNATRILATNGVTDRLWAESVEPEAVVLRDARGLVERARVLVDSARTRWNAPYLTIHRADLQRALIAAVDAEPSIEFTLGAEIATAASGKCGVAVTLVDGKTIEASMLVGADGVSSAVRRAIGGPLPGYSGKVAFRASMDAAHPMAVLCPADQVSVFLHPGVHLVAYPVEAGRRLNLVAVARGRENGGDASPAVHFERTAPALRGLVGSAGPWTVWPIRTVPASSAWSDGQTIVLIGDAAHAMTPYSAQGAAMAIEDAEVLAGLIAANPAGTAQAIAAFVAARKARVAKVRDRGSLNELAWHARGPVALARNIVLKKRGAEKLTGDLDWLYGWTPEA